MRITAKINRMSFCKSSNVMSCKLPFYITARFEIKSEGTGALHCSHEWIKESISSITVGPVFLLFWVQCAAGFKRCSVRGSNQLSDELQNFFPALKHKWVYLFHSGSNSLYVGPCDKHNEEAVRRHQEEARKSSFLWQTPTWFGLIVLKTLQGHNYTHSHVKHQENNISFLDN